jgi:hypothetical protein
MLIPVLFLEVYCEPVFFDGHEHLVADVEPGVAEPFALEHDERYGMFAARWPLVVHLEPAHSPWRPWPWRFACAAPACLVGV